MANVPKQRGRILRAPEHFVDGKLADDITAEGWNEQRRGFLRRSFLAAAGALAGGPALAQAGGDPVILNLPEHARTLGKPVASNPYGMPSKYETNLLRRESPGLTRGGAGCGGTVARARSVSAIGERGCIISWADIADSVAAAGAA